MPKELTSIYVAADNDLVAVYFPILTLFVAGNSTQMTLIDMIFADFNSLSYRNQPINCL